MSDKSVEAVAQPPQDAPSTCTQACRPGDGIHAASCFIKRQEIEVARSTPSPDPKGNQDAKSEAVPDTNDHPADTCNDRHNGADSQPMALAPSPDPPQPAKDYAIEDDPRFMYAPHPCCGDAHMELMTLKEHMKQLGIVDDVTEENGCNIHVYRNIYKPTPDSPPQIVSAPDAEQWLAKNICPALMADISDEIPGSVKVYRKSKVLMLMNSYAREYASPSNAQLEWSKNMIAHYLKCGYLPELSAVEAKNFLGEPLLEKQKWTNPYDELRELRSERDGLREALRVALDELHEVNLANSHGNRPRNPEMTIFAEVQARAALGTESTEKG